MDQNKKDGKILVQTSWVSAIGNLILSLSKIIVGIISGSLAVIGDGIDSASDVIISIVMILTAHIVNRPPSKKYAYGYQKAEGIATKILSLVILYAGIQMLVSSITALFSEQDRELPNSLAIYVTVFSIIGKLGLAWYQYKKGKQIKSQLLIANAVNMRNDIFISISVLAGLVFTYVFKLPILDVITGLLISLFIIKSAIDIFIESNISLMDGVHNEEIYEEIFKAVESVDGASNPHRVRSRQIGNMYMIALDIEVDGNITLIQAHQIANKVEDSIRNTIENVYDIVVHVEPNGKDHPSEKFGIDKNTI